MQERIDAMSPVEAEICCPSPSNAAIADELLKLITQSIDKKNNDIINVSIPCAAYITGN